MKWTRWMLLFWLSVSGRSWAQSTDNIVTYISTYKDLAVSEMQRTGVPASIILAQGIHETLAGTSELVKKSNNHFGIKCKENWTGKVVYHDDDERGECFRSYASAEDSYKDHSDFLRGSPRYQFLFRYDPVDFENWAYGLKKAGYATNKKYPEILIRLIKDYGLQQYTFIALNRFSEADQIAAAIPASRSAGGVIPTVTTVVAQKQAAPPPPAPQYPDGVFSINRTKVVFAHSGVAMLSLADQYDVPLARLIEFNDMKSEDVLVRDQLVYLQRKRKVGATEFHIVQTGETVYDICQAEGIRYESILVLNKLLEGEQPAVGEKLNLQQPCPSKPKLAQLNDQPADDGAAVQIDKPETSEKTHIVQQKETLYSISRRYGVKVDQIRSWNKLDSADLKVGQALVIYQN